MDWASRVQGKSATLPGLVTTAAAPPAPVASVDDDCNNHVFKKVATVALASAVAIGGFAIAKEKNFFSKDGKILQTAEYLAKGFHAIPAAHANPLRTLPSMHRLLNVAGMVGGFAGVQYLSNIIFACKINGSNCEELKRENVPTPLRPLYGVAAYNPFDDNDPNAQWHKVIHQMLPAVAGAVGAIKGSEMFFRMTGKEQRYEELMKKEHLTPQEADTAAQFAQSKFYRWAAGMTAWTSAASGWTPAYGDTLNPGFNSGNNGKLYPGAAELFGFEGIRKVNNTTGDLGVGPERAQGEMEKAAQTLLKDLQGATPDKAQEFIKAYADRATKNVTISLVEKPQPHEVEALAKDLHGKIEAIIAEQKALGKTPEQFSKEVGEALKGMYGSTAIPDIGKRLKAGQNGLVGWLSELVPSIKKEVEGINKRMIRPGGVMI